MDLVKCSYRKYSNKIMLVGMRFINQLNAPIYTSPLEQFHMQALSLCKFRVYKRFFINMEDKTSASNEKSKIVHYFNLLAIRVCLQTELKYIINQSFVVNESSIRPHFFGMNHPIYK